MTLNSLVFIVFFAAVLFLLWISGIIIKNKKAYREAYKWWLILFSFGFTAYADIRFCACLFALSLFTYFAGILMEKWDRHKKGIIGAGAAGSLLFLGIFKYYNFFMEQISRLFGRSHGAIAIILPLGISFYTFSALGYMIDVYRGKYKAEGSFSQLLLYICFFPKLGSGPIVRFDSFKRQMGLFCGIRAENLSAGMVMFVYGMFKKMVLADHLGVFVDDVFYSPSAFSSLTIFWAAVSYSLQIYFDFSGYSDMAIGCAKMLGFHFDKNFNFPYLSGNLTEFWKRWHISLSSWLQEYLYYSLGGNRKGRVRTYINLLLTMLLGGLWHGTAWTFILWGFFHGIGLVVHKLFLKWKKSCPYAAFFGSSIWHGISVVLTFLYVSLCWIFFRAEDFMQAKSVIWGMLAVQGGIAQIYAWTIFALILLAAVTVYMAKKGRTGSREAKADYPVPDLNTVSGLTLFFVLIGLTIGMAYVGDTAFIYGAF